MESISNVDYVSYDNIDELKRCMDNRYHFTINLCEKDEEEDSSVLISIACSNTDTGCTLFIDMKNTELKFFAESLLSMIKNKRPI